MALIAINAVIHVAAYAAVARVGRSGGMASGALKDRIVAGIRVACCTDTLGVAVTNGKPGVIERRPCPCRGRVARLTSGREPGGQVVRIVGSLIVRFVTAVAVGRETRIVVVHMAARAEHAGVGPG